LPSLPGSDPAGDIFLPDGTFTTVPNFPAAPDVLATDTNIGGWRSLSHAFDLKLPLGAAPFGL
jgi:hypothetical protein